MATATKATNKREAVMRAALDLFVERGFYGTAVPEIADKADPFIRKCLLDLAGNYDGMVRRSPRLTATFLAACQTSQ